MPCRWLASDPAMMSDMQVFHFLLDNRADIRRTVTILPNGIDTLTESDKPEIATKLKTHVSAMYGRLKDGRPIHQRDPLFVELFAHADQIDANITYTEKGLRRRRNLHRPGRGASAAQACGRRGRLHQERHGGDDEGPPDRLREWNLTRLVISWPEATRGSTRSAIGRRDRTVAGSRRRPSIACREPSARWPA